MPGNPKQLFLLNPRKRNKYGAKRVRIDGHTFDSRAEAARYILLKRMGKAIDILNLHPKWKFANGKTYTADFEYWINEYGHRKRIVEDVKGVRTALYKFKKAQMKSEFGIDIQEIEIDAKTADTLIKAYLGARK